MRRFGPSQSDHECNRDVTTIDAASVFVYRHARASIVLVNAKLINPKHAFIALERINSEGKSILNSSKRALIVIFIAADNDVNLF